MTYMDIDALIYWQRIAPNMVWEEAEKCCSSGWYFFLFLFFWNGLHVSMVCA